MKNELMFTRRLSFVLGCLFLPVAYNTPKIFLATSLCSMTKDVLLRGAVTRLCTANRYEYHFPTAPMCYKTSLVNRNSRAEWP